MKNVIIELSADEHKYEEIVPYLHEKDGYRHILLLTGFAKMTSKPFECEEKFTLQLDDFITHMQKNDYELLDVKVSPIGNSNVLGTASGYSVCIVYR